MIICFHCEEEIEKKEIATVDSSGNQFHHECFWRGVIGSVSHIERRCSCFVPSSTENDPLGLTKRQAAKLAFEAWKKLEENKKGENHEK